MRTIRRITSAAVLLAVCSTGLSANAKYGGGTGEPNTPYLIYTAEQMNAIGANWKDWDKHFKLMADIDLSTYAGKDFRIIGTGISNAFKGVFDGNNRRISNFRYTSANRDYTGLFGYIKNREAEIRNVGLINPNIDVGTGTCAGSLVGYLYEGTITNCYSTGGSVSGKRWVGGLIGQARAGTITNCYTVDGTVSGNEQAGGLAGFAGVEIKNCYSSCIVSGNRNIGGLVGDNRGPITASSAAGMVSGEQYYIGGLVGNNSDQITDCFARGDVLGLTNVGGLAGNNGGAITGSCSNGSISGEDDIGGLVGQNNGGTISNCCATGTVSGVQNVGGLAGVNSSYTRMSDSMRLSGKITYCYSTGGVTGTTDIGGLVGLNNEGEVSASFWDIQTSGRTDMCGRQTPGTDYDNANGKTTAEMQMQSTFLDAGWDFVAESANGIEEIWSICEGLDYPKLAWQFLPGDFDGDSKVGLADFAVFAENWLSIDRGFFWCRGTDITGDGYVDFSDLEVFTDNWLAQGVRNHAVVNYIIVDDFESYNDLEPGNPESNRIFDAWLDGYGNRAANGAIIGYDNPPFAERSIVHGGGQSMPYFYDTLFKFSKAELPLDPPQDWIAEGAEILSLWFHGDRSNAPAPMSVVLSGSSTVYYDNPEAVRLNSWTQWKIEIQAFTGADLSDVHSIAICFGDQNNVQVGGSGRMFFDDIRLYRSR